MVTGLQAKWYEVSVSKRAKVPPPRNVHTMSGVYPAVCSVDTGSFHGIEVTGAHLHLAPRLRMSGALPLLPLYVFMLQTRPTLSTPYSILVSQTRFDSTGLCYYVSCIETPMLRVTVQFSSGQCTKPFRRFEILRRHVTCEPLDVSVA